MQYNVYSPSRGILYEYTRSPFCGLPKHYNNIIRIPCGGSALYRIEYYYNPLRDIIARARVRHAPDEFALYTSPRGWIPTPVSFLYRGIIGDGR